jgi:glycosyltransferase involved in cell wall biosynthesis
LGCLCPLGAARGRSHAFDLAGLVERGWGSIAAVPAKRPVLVQPPSGGRLSGGFLYNARMAEHEAWEILDLPAHALAELPQRLGEKRLILMDSIWLASPTVEVFLELRARGWDVGVMLHSFPSMIAAAENQRPLVRAPLASEIAALERFGLVLVPGPHYAELLTGCSARLLDIEPGIDDAWRAEPRPRTGLCRLVSVGTVTARKGFLDLADVLRARQAQGAEDFAWTVVGSLDADLDYSRSLVERTRPLAHITLAGQQSPARTQRIVCNSDVLVMPSYDENQPLVLVEAMAASVPAVAYAAGAAHRMLEHGKEGLIAPIGDKDTLAALLGSLIEDEPRRHSMACACWDRQRSIPSWSDAAARARSELRAIGASFEA